VVRLRRSPDLRLDFRVPATCQRGRRHTRSDRRRIGPLRRRVQSFIDRRFYTNKYDAQKTLQDFGARLRDEVDLDTLREDLVAVVEDTLKPEHVSFWLRPSGTMGGEER
jgi:hypothetical protein